LKTPREILEMLPRQIRFGSILQTYRRHIRFTGLTVAGLATIVVFFILGALIRVLIGPVSLGPFNGEVADAISQSLPGLAVGYDQAAIQWSRDEHRINLVILGARVLDEDQRIIAQAPKAEVDLAAEPFLHGKIVVQRIALVGVQLTLVRTKNGGLRLGLDRDAADNDVLERIREAIEHAKGGASSLNSFAVRHARLAFYDQLTGAFIISPDANFQISTGESAADKAAPYLVATVDSSVEISGSPAHLYATIKLPRAHGQVTGDMSFTGLSLRALGQNSKTFNFLTPLDLKADVTGSFILDHGTFLRYADLGIGASGAVYGLGSPLRVRSLKLVGRYDGVTGRLLIDDAEMEGDHAREHMTGEGNLVFDKNETLTQAAMNLTADRFTLNMPGVVTRAVTLGRIYMRTVYTPADQKISIERFDVSGGAMNAQLKGSLTLNQTTTPAIALDGTINAMEIGDFMHYWPLHVGEGAREWIIANIPHGRIGPIALHADIKAGMLDLPALPDEALNLGVPLSSATVIYVHGMTPMVNVVGRATLLGDTFKATIASGNVGAIRLSKGDINIPNLNAHGTVGDIKAHVESSMGDLLRLIDEKPLQYATKFNLNPATSKGATSTDIEVRVPMLRDAGTDEIGIAAKVAVANLAMTIGKDTHITGGNVIFDITNDRLRAVGNMAMGGGAVGIDWTEDFRTKSPITSTIIAKGMVDEATRATLGLNTGGIISGPVGVSGQLLGHHGQIQRANLALDLTPATMAVDVINFHKPPGTPATAQINAVFEDDGSARAETIAVTGPTLSTHGSMSFAPGGGLQKLDLSDVHAGPNNDFAISLTDKPAGFDLSVHGRSADGTGFGHSSSAQPNASPSSTPPPPSNTPFHVTARLDHVVLREGVLISAFSLDANGAGDRAQSMTLNGTLPKSRLTGSVAPGTDGRHLILATGDAGTLLKGLFGFDSVRGGDLALNVTLSPAAKPNTKPYDYMGSMVIQHFKVLNLPFLSRLFAAGSLTGVADLLRGEGITMDKLEMPFRANGDIVSVHDARAAGPAVGITADGYFDRSSSQIDLKGTLAPVYGINSVLGVIPLLGDLLTSKPGEGVIGMTYHAKGAADNPDISINPLSAFAPGIFRRIFEGSMPTAPSQANSSLAPNAPVTPAPANPPLQQQQ